MARVMYAFFSKITTDSLAIGAFKKWREILECDHTIFKA